MPLTDLQCKAAQPQTKPYKILDSNGLHLQINPSGAKYWRYRFRLHGKQLVLALGKYPVVSLADARERRDNALKEVEAGKNPILLQAERKQVARYQASQTFEQIGLEWWERNKYKWSAKHAQLVKYRLTKYLFSKTGSYPITDVSPQVLLSCIQPVEATSPIVARRLLQYCNKIFEYAQITGRYNLPIFTAGLKQLIRTPKKGHFAAIELEELPQLLQAIYTNKACSRRITTLAMIFMLLTFQRTKEMLQAKKEEINFDTAMWIIPGERMKMKLPHLVPLSRQAIAVLKEAYSLTPNSEYLFPSLSNPHKPMSNMVLLTALKQMGYKGRMTGHGFRSIAAGVATEKLGYDFDIIDRQLSHVPQSEVRRAYDRAKLLPQRICFMQNYADYLENELTNHLQKGTTNERTTERSENASQLTIGRFNSAQYKGSSAQVRQYQPFQIIQGDQNRALPKANEKRS